jgi:hypothetical protein
MEQPPHSHQSFFRRLLFPYSGEEALTPRQSLRVILAWAIPIPLSMSLCTLALSALLRATVYQTILLFVLAFLSGLLIFGGLGWLIVSMNNRSAYLRQERKARGVGNTGKTGNTSNHQWR